MNVLEFDYFNMYDLNSEVALRRTSAATYHTKHYILCLGSLLVVNLPLTYHFNSNRDLVASIFLTKAHRYSKV